MWRSKSGKLYQSSTKKEIQKPKLEVVDCHGMLAEKVYSYL